MDIRGRCWIQEKCQKRSPSRYFFISNLGHPINLVLALSSAEKKKKPSIESMFDDVYDVRTPELERQYAELLEHLDEYGDKYNLDIYNKS